MITDSISKYRILREIGRGGMGIVYLARDESLGRDVAVKVLLPQYAQQASVVNRFLNEARTMASLHHPSIMGVYEFGEDVNGYYFVMEHIVGDDLANVLRRDGPMPPARAARIVAEIASALDYAHGAGVVHRDVKPENVLIGLGDAPKVADFGIAKQEGEMSLTQTGVLNGTADYMAPEIWEGKFSSPKSDQYSLAVLAYELMAGRVPFTGETAVTKGFAHVHHSVPSLALRDGDPALAERINAALTRALAKKPDDRFESAKAFADALARALEAPQASSYEASPTIPTRPSRRRSPFLVGAGVAVVGVALALGLLAASRRLFTSGPPPTVATAPPAGGPATSILEETDRKLAEAEQKGRSFALRADRLIDADFMAADFDTAQRALLEGLDESGQSLVATASSGKPEDAERRVGLGHYLLGKADLLRLNRVCAVALAALRPLSAAEAAAARPFAARAASEFKMYVELTPDPVMTKPFLDEVANYATMFANLGFGGEESVGFLNDALAAKRSRTGR